MKVKMEILIISSFGILILLFIVALNHKLKIKNKGLLISYYLLLISLFGIFFYQLKLNDWKFDLSSLFFLLIIIFNLILEVLFLEKYHFALGIINKNKFLEEYVQTSNELIEKYSLKLHRYQNNLIVIKGYLEKNKKEATNYIDTLLDSYEIKKYKWLREINYINDKVIRYFIYYKLHAAEKENLHIIVSVSKELQKIMDYDLIASYKSIFLEVLGEYFDNAIAAAKASKDQELIFNLYTTNQKIIYKIANTYSGKVKLDLVNKYGYTTKGKGHGIGLYDVDLKLKHLSNIKSEYQIMDNYFLITLTIKLDKKDKKTLNG